MTSSFGSRAYPLPDELNPLRLRRPPGPGPAATWSGCSSTTWARGG